MFGHEYIVMSCHVMSCVMSRGERPDLSRSGEDPVLMSASVVTLPQSHLASPVKTELGGGVPEVASGHTAVSGNQEVRIDSLCKKVSL